MVVRRDGRSPRSLAAMVVRRGVARRDRSPRWSPAAVSIFAMSSVAMVVRRDVARRDVARRDSGRS
jgi:hypothetical protein